MYDFMTGFSFVVSIASFVIAILAYKRCKAAFHIISSRKTRTVTVDMQDGKVTIIKEQLNDDAV